MSDPDPYELHRELPALERPVLVVMLTGWIDASGAAAAAMAAVEEQCGSEPLATFDSDVFIDYRARRPVMELREGVNTRLVWSDIQLKAGTSPGGVPVLTLTGPEPDANWRRFAREVTALALRLGAYQMVGLGAYPFATPHTRPSRLSCTTPSAELAAQAPFLKNSVDVPAGVGAVLEHALTEAGIASLGLWVQVPHYVSAMNYPSASAALLTGLKEATGLELDAGDLQREATIQRVRIDRLVEGNEEHTEMVRQLEVAYDSALAEDAPSGPAASMLNAVELPSGDELAAEFERFLRDQDD